MIGFQHRLARGLAALAAGTLAGFAVGCDKQPAEEPNVAVTAQPQLGDLVDNLADQCGLDLDCSGGGIAEGRASISGVPEIDAFFGAVINFQSKASLVAGGIDAELRAIRGDFGIDAEAELGAEIMAQADLYLEGDLEIVAEPARCQIDASASVEAAAHCDAEVDPGMVMVECQGSCEVEASADVDCGADADLKCTATAPSIACEGECQGSCTLEAGAMADCNGTCHGECSAGCSLMNAQGECEGTCEGQCMGSCEVEFDAAAECSGTCKGECTVTNPEAGCEGGVKAHCEAHADAMVMCEGSCDGEVTPPMVKAECEATAKAEASFSAECTPPRLAINYELAVGGNVDVEAQARFEAALKNLEVRLPKLLASLKRADLVVEAGTELGASGAAAVQGAIDEIDTDASLFLAASLVCAAGELEPAADAITNGTGRLNASIQATAELRSSLGLDS